MNLPTRMASGFLIYRWPEDGLPEWLVLWNAERKEAGFAKGHAEDGESALEAAVRETTEETGLEDLAIGSPFQHTLAYDVTRRGMRYHKTVHYFVARADRGEVALSHEHERFAWLPYPEAREALEHRTLRHVLEQAALWMKDPLVARTPGHAFTEREAHAHLSALPHAAPKLVAHLEGGARIARALAEALAKQGLPIEPEFAAAGTLLHDVGRALGHEADHPQEGARHLRATRFATTAPFAWTHFTKGATAEDLLRAGVAESTLAQMAAAFDPQRFTWEERIAALADACMKGAQAATPRERFADLRIRYPNSHALIALQEREVAKIVASFSERLGPRFLDPLLARV